MQTYSLTRRQFMVGGTALLAPGRVAWAQIPSVLLPVRVALDWVPGADCIGLLRGLRLGDFRKKNLDVSFTAGGPNAPAPLVFLAAGKSDIVSATWLSAVDAMNRGNDFVVIAAQFPQSPGGILSLPSKPIRHPSDIAGKKMMLQDPSLSVILDGMQAFAGVRGAYTVVPTGFSADPLFAGDGDGYLCYVNNQPLELEASGLKPDKDFVLASFHQLGYDIPESLIVVKRTMIDNHRAVLVDYLEVLLAGMKAHERAPEADIRALVDTYGQDYGLEYETELKKDRLEGPLTFAQDGRRYMITGSQMDRMMQLLTLTGREVPDRKKCFDFSILQEATARL